MAKVLCAFLFASVGIVLGQYQRNHYQSTFNSQSEVEGVLGEQQRLGVNSFGGQQRTSNGQERSIIAQIGTSSARQGTYDSQQSLSRQQNRNSYGQQLIGYTGQQSGSLGSQNAVNYGYQYNDYSEPANYDYSYQISEPQSYVEFSHQEQRHGDNTQGNYQVLLPDGSLQHVVYTADHDGYRPVVSYYGDNQGSNGNRVEVNSYENIGSGQRRQSGY